MAKYFDESMSYEEAYFYLVDAEENGFLTDDELEEFRDEFNEIAPRLRGTNGSIGGYNGFNPGC